MTQAPAAPAPERQWVWFPVPRRGSDWAWACGIFTVASLLACGLATDVMNAPDPGTPGYDAWSEEHGGTLVLVGIGVPMSPVLVFWLSRLLFFGALKLHERWQDRTNRLHQRKAQHELLLTERVNALHVNVRHQQRSLHAMARETQEVADELEVYLRDRLAVLDRLSAELRDKEELAKNTPQMVEALDNWLEARSRRDLRSNRRLQYVSLVVAILFGFVVNWLSNPVLTMLRTWLE
ncbi:hypothetical protein [Actinoplanes subglobosus]|uniref:Uncharacterized protein n=1 Tax=Actinoplanes subglobosus TaxID=1547892 RepID=A0ABV8J0R2_9ACTN